ncbi:MAG: TonB-dependent receptor plug domain-containing protein, partial [Actinomycetota bacterium]|nr:TonB-dependent receptor plug domain-containing protein [Actinomycetota bacterium]
MSTAALALVAGQAFAQTAETVQVADAMEAGAGSEDRVVVTGSRVATGEDAPTPVMQLSLDDLNITTPTNIADSLGQMPVFANSPGSSRTGFGIAGGNFLNMRSLGSNRTLVLLDGRRFVTSALPGSGATSVNVDSIPQGLVKRVDTVTGGASAAYGSDAVAGVVNFVLDTEFEGLKAEIVGGQTFRDDGFNWKAQISGGGSFADGRGHVLLNVEHAQSDGIEGEHSGKRKPPRPWMDSVNAIVANPLAAQPGQPAFITLENARFPYYTFEGMVRSGPLLGTGFNPDGSTKPYDLGNPVAGVWASGGDGWNPSSAYDLAAAYDRSALFGRVSYDLTDTLNVYAEAMFATVDTESHVGHGYADAISPGGLPVSLDYAYLPANLRTEMVNRGLTTLRIGKGFESIGQSLNSATTRIVVGADGAFGGGWDWSTYYQYGQTKGAIEFENVQNSIAFRNALDAVVGPNGIVCRSTLTNPFDGCVPYNIFGDRGDGTGNGFTQAEHDYLFPTARYSNSNSQHVFEATVHGTAFAKWAGDVNVAAGGGYRKESLERGSNQLAGLRNPYTGVVGAYAYANQPAIEGA